MRSSIKIKFALVVVGLMGIINAHAQDVLIASNKPGTLYIGMFNPITVLAKKYQCRALIVSTDNGNVARRDSCLFDITPITSGTATITVGYLQGRDTVVLLRQVFRAKWVPHPEAFAGGKTGGAIPARLLQVQLGLYAELNDWIFEGPAFEIRRFKMTVLKTNGASKQAESRSGGLFTAEMMALLSHLEPGDEVLFTNIYVDSPYEKGFRVPGLDFTIE